MIMFLHNGKEYYPLEIRKIMGQNEKVIYDRDKRGKSYVYIAVESKKEGYE